MKQIEKSRHDKIKEINQAPSVERELVMFGNAEGKHLKTASGMAQRKAGWQLILHNSSAPQDHVCNRE